MNKVTLHQGAFAGNYTGDCQTVGDIVVIKDELRKVLDANSTAKVYYYGLLTLKNDDSKITCMVLDGVIQPETLKVIEYHETAS